MFSYLRRLFTASLLYLLPPFPPSRPYSLPPFPPSLSYSLPPLQHPALWISETVTCLAGLCKLPGMAGTGRSIDHPAVFSPPGPRFSWTVKRVARCVDERVTCMETALPPQLHPHFPPHPDMFMRMVDGEGIWRTIPSRLFFFHLPLPSTMHVRRCVRGCLPLLPCVCERERDCMELSHRLPEHEPQFHLKDRIVQISRDSEIFESKYKPS